MKRLDKRRITRVLFAFCALVMMVPSVAFAAEGDYGIGMSPMKEWIVLNAGEQYKSSFVISNPSTNTTDFHYVANVSPFYVNENYDVVYEDFGSINQMAGWITLSNYEGILTPNSAKEIYYTVNVPEDAPAGGQYAAIIVQSQAMDSESSFNDEENAGLQINQVLGISHIIYAEISGTTRRSGEILSADVPGFLFSGNISGNSTIKNTGNVHGEARYTLQVFPLFSDEEIYTNEEKSKTKTVVPDRILYNETSWNETPGIGVFNVVYTVEFEGVTTQVSKLVIKCPIWLLFIIIFVIFAIIFWLMMRVRSRKKSGGRKKSVEENTEKSE